MENGTIPLRHGSLPGSLRLPKRYEMSTQGKHSEPTYNRKLSMIPPHEETEEERCQDLMQAILWIKQELILLRQHDILLKRQFGDIQDTINSLSKSRHKKNTKGTLVATSNTSLQSNGSSDFGMDNYSVRSANSVTALDETDVNDEDDILGDFRPRTCSMKTTRDLAALARRRGSKELI